MPSPPAFATARSTRSASSPPAPLSIRIGRGNRRSNFCFEGIGDALGRIFADAEADRGSELGTAETGGNIGRASGTPKVSAHPAPRERGERLVSFVGPVSAALEEIVVFFGTNRKQTELRETRIGIDHDAVRQADSIAQLRPHREPVINGPTASVSDRKMLQPRIGGEQFPAFLGTGEPDGRVGKALFRGIENDAGDRDIGAEGHTRKHENVVD